jgi:hypothetical protein
MVQFSLSLMSEVEASLVESGMKPDAGKIRLEEMILRYANQIY